MWHIHISYNANNLFTSSSIYSQVNPDSFKRYYTARGKNYIQSEYNIQKDSIFLRNAKIGKIVPKSKVKDIVSDEYFTKIKDTSRLAAISESFYLFLHRLEVGQKWVVFYCFKVFFLQSMNPASRTPLTIHCPLLIQKEM